MTVSTPLFRLSGVSLAALALAGAALLTSPHSALAQAKEPVKVGALFTTSGGGAQTGLAALLGAKMAAAEINAAGGILGRPVVLVQGDDAADTTQAVTETKRMIYQEKVHIMLGPLYSATTIAAAKAVMAQETGVTYWSFGTSAQITVELASTLFTYGPGSNSLADAMLDYALDIKKSKNLAILTDEIQNSIIVIERMKERMKERGFTNYTIEQFAANAADMTPNLLRVKAKNPDFMLLSQTFLTDTAVILKNMDELNWNIQAAGNNGVAISYPVIAKTAGPSAIKRLVAGVGIKPFTYCTGDALGTSDYAKFLVRLKAFEPKMDPATQIVNVAEMYDELYAAKAAAEGAGSLDGKKMTEWLENNSGKLKLLAAYPHLSKTNHFLALADSLTMVENMGDIRSDGMLKRAGC